MKQSGSAFAAFLLDHRGKAQLLNVSETETAFNYINKVNPETVLHVMNFISRELPFSKQLFEVEYLKSAPTAWRTSGLQLGFDKGLVELATGLVSAVCSSGGSARQFSTMGFTHGLLSTQLGVEKADIFCTED